MQAPALQHRGLGSLICWPLALSIGSPFDPTSDPSASSVGQVRVQQTDIQLRYDVIRMAIKMYPEHRSCQRGLGEAADEETTRTGSRRPRFGDASPNSEAYHLASRSTLPHATGPATWLGQRMASRSRGFGRTVLVVALQDAQAIHLRWMRIKRL